MNSNQEQKESFAIPILLFLFLLLMLLVLGTGAFTQDDLNCLNDKATDYCKSQNYTFDGRGFFKDTFICDDIQNYTERLPIKHNYITFYYLKDEIKECKIKGWLI